MSSLNAFLHPVAPANKEVIISDRFVEDGKPVPFVIRPIMQDENMALIKKCTKKNKSGESELDRPMHALELATAAVVFPDLQNAELQKAYGVLGASALLKKMLLIGEYGRLLEEVQTLSGLDSDINDMIEDAKNG